MAQQNPYQSPSDPDTAPPTPRARLAREIKLHGSMPLTDVLHTQFLIVAKRWPYAALCLLIYTAFVVTLALLNRESSLFSNTYLVLGLVVMPGILPLAFFMVYLRLRRDAKRQVGIFAVTNSTLMQDGIEASVDGETVSVPWSAFSGFLSSPRVVILFLKDSNAHLIVSRAKLAHQEDWPRLQSFLHDQLPRW